MDDPDSFRRPSPRSDSRSRSGLGPGSISGARPRASDRKTGGSSWRDAARGLGPWLLAIPVAAFSAVLLADGLPALRASADMKDNAAAGGTPLSANFHICVGGVRHTCVVNGDTIWLNGEKIRIADIDAPEISQPACEAERIAGTRATERLTAWLNAGAFEVHPNPEGRDADRYGRKLRVLARGGESAVEALEAEGLATRWGEARRRWC